MTSHWDPVLTQDKERKSILMLIERVGGLDLLTVSEGKDVLSYGFSVTMVLRFTLLPIISQDTAPLK